MIKLIIDIVLLIIIAFCTWRGFRRGIVGGIAGILGIVIALFGGNYLSTAYAHEVIPALEPFVDGYISSQNTKDAVLEEMGYAGSDLSLNDILARDSSLRYDYAYGCMRAVGFYEGHAQKLADKAVDWATENNAGMEEAVVSVLCDTVTYVGGLLIGFLLILILLVAVTNVIDLPLRLPNLAALDDIGGAGLGFVKGFMFCVLLCWMLGFFGIVLGEDTLSGTTLGRFFLAFDFLTKGLI